MEVLDDLLEHLLVRAARDEAHLLHRADDAPGVARQRALDQLDDARRARSPGISATAPKSRNTIVGGPPSPLGPDEQVPGVRIGVIDAVGEDLLAVDLDDLARELRCDRGRAA